VGRRIVIVSTDAAFAAKHAQALGGLPEVEVQTLAPERCADAGSAALWLVDVAEGSAIPQVSGPILAIAPNADLSRWLDVLAASDSVVGVIDDEAVPAGELRALVSRLIDTAPVTVEALLAADAERYECAVGDYRDKQRCMGEVVAITDRLEMPRRTQTLIEQCLDELVMNALYTAPVDSAGQPVFAGVPSGKRVTMRTDATVGVRCAWDRQRFVVAVGDEFGALSRATVLTHLAKGLATSEPGRRVGGAGRQVEIRGQFFEGVAVGFVHMQNISLTKIIVIYILRQ